MSRLRALLVLSVVAGLSLFGAGMLSYAQKPGEDVQTVSPKQKLRDRFVMLQAEVETLRLERDAMRAGLLKLLTDMEQADIMGIDLASLMGTAKVELGGLSGDAGSLKEMSDIMEAMQGDDPKAAMEKLKASTGKLRAGLLSRIAEKKKDFDRKVRALGEKELDLDELKRRMAEVR
jgi:hypothetical protein